MLRQLRVHRREQPRIVGGDIRREARHHFAVAVHQELLEVPQHFIQRAAVDAETLEPLAERAKGGPAGLQIRPEKSLARIFVQFTT